MKLPAGPYAVVAVDPPWDMGFGAMLKPDSPTNLHCRRSPLPYETLSLAEIAAIDVRSLLAEDAFVLLWCPSSKVGAAQTIIREWGLKALGWRVWHKTDGGPQLPGKWRSDAEFVLVGARGKPRWLSTRGFGTVFAAPRPRRTDPCACERSGVRRCSACPPRFKHSAKPPEFYADIAARTVGPRLDMFARARHPGWEAWGDEATP